VLSMWRVKVPLAAFRILALLAFAGLLLAPMAGPVAAMHSANGSVQEGTVADSAAAMPDDMPCCPGKRSIPDCDKDCLIMCCAMVLHNTANNGLIAPLVLASTVLPGEASALVGLAQEPPRKRPKA
jgi:hypothetical protein